MERRPCRILVTNDDGVDAPGLDVLVSALAADPENAVSVVAPATNRSGARGDLTTGVITVRPAATAGGRPATAVLGSPSDAVMLAIRQLLDAPPDLVIAGLNAGPNLGEFIEISGTVAAASTAARLGIPAMAASQGLALPMQYDGLAKLIARFVVTFRSTPDLREAMRGIVLNVNCPPCENASVRGVCVVPLGRVVDVQSYVRSPTSGDDTTYVPSVTFGDVTRADCLPGDRAPQTDLEAYSQGFVSITPLASGSTPLERLERFDALLSRGLPTPPGAP